MFYVNGGSFIAIGLIFPVLGLIAVLARFIIRLTLRQSCKADDWLCIPAWLSTLGCGIILIYGSAVKSFGYSSTPTTPEEVPEDTQRIATQIKLVLLFNIISILAVGFIKLSLCFFYRRIFRGKIFNIISWVLISILIVWTGAFFILAWAQCGTYMHELLTTGSAEFLKERCLNTTASLAAMAVSDLILDVIILLLPLFWIWRLQMQTAQKVAVSAVFMVGIFATATAAVRTAAFIQLDYVWPKLGLGGDILGYKDTSDVEGVQSVYIFWSYISCGTGMVVSCLPSLRAAFRGTFWSSVVASLRSSAVPLRKMSSNFFQRSDGSGSGGSQGFESRSNSVAVGAGGMYPSSNRDSKHGDIEAHVNEVAPPMPRFNKNEYSNAV